ncbi:hypothetical protein CXT76_01150 [Candidatus Parvarchaeota archaeon]|jgi:hypothetical protein|nr:MAG: hypothetical protein CXT76_01150 [Candidatus Parvarchaeota archaeon]HIG52365.1 hypothetical protein [Candidatus Pacearchaeota archaeon]
MGITLMILIGIALFVFIKYTGFIHGNLWTKFIISMFIFTFVSFVIVSAKQGLNFWTFDGLLASLKIYIHWLIGFSGDVGSVTGRIIERVQ